MEAGLHLLDTVFELHAFFGEVAVAHRGLAATVIHGDPRQELVQKARTFGSRPRHVVERNDDEEALLHDVGDVDDLLDESGVGFGLGLEERIALLLGLDAGLLHIRVNVHLGGTHHDLDGEGKRIHEAFVTRDDTLLFRLAFEVEVEGFHLQHGPQTSIFQKHGVIAHLGHRQKPLRGGMGVFLARADSAFYRLVCGRTHNEAGGAMSRISARATEGGCTASNGVEDSRGSALTRLLSTGREEAAGVVRSIA